MRIVRLWLGLAAAAACTSGISSAQETPLAWEDAPKYKYNIINVSLDAGTRKVTVVFNVTNPLDPKAQPYDILALPSGSTLRVLVGWNTGTAATELVNTGSLPQGPNLPSRARTWMATIPPNPGAVAPAGPTSINALSSAAAPCTQMGTCGGVAYPERTYWVTATLPPQARGLGRVAIEGHPVKVIGTSPTGTPLLANIPVKSAFTDFAIDSAAKPRRTVVEFTRCQGCHDGKVHGDGVVPRLSLHGSNRNEELGVCVICHNPDQTDAAYRSSGSEESIDFKRLVHGIHGNKKRKTPLVVVGFRGTVVDYGHVKFPGNARNCLTCHVDINGKGTFEITGNTGLGSTINTQSDLTPLGGFVDVNPANNLRISPTAAACSGCHNSSETQRHMVQQGASFGQSQELLAGKERCATCHGPGKSKDVRKVHEVRSTSGISGAGRDAADDDEEEEEDKKDDKDKK